MVGKAAVNRDLREIHSMAIIQLVLSAIICGILYLRMIRREVPVQIGKAQARYDKMTNQGLSYIFHL